MSDDVVSIKKEDYNKIVTALMFYAKAYNSMANVLGVHDDFDEGEKSVFILSFEQDRFKRMLLAIQKVDTERNEFKQESARYKSDFRTSLLVSGIVIFLLLCVIWK